MRTLVAAGLLLAMGSTAAEAQKGAWLTRLGSDTVAFERYQRTGQRLEADLFVVAPRTRRTHYVATFGADGSVTRFELDSRAVVEGPGVAGPVTAVFEISPTAVVATTTRAGKTDTARIATTGSALPNVLYAWSLMQLAVERAVKAGGEATVEQVGVGARQAASNQIKRVGDSISVEFFGSPMMAVVDKSGRLVGVDGGHTTVKVRAVPAPNLDVDKLAETFAARDRAGTSAGVLSTRDTVVTSVAGADLWIDYGRPAKRGRKILGGIVPFGEVWRTGANAATQFRTSVPLSIEGAAVPAGTYTLWTLPTAGGVQLIVNKQVGQWGTLYDPAQDLVRVPMKSETLGQGVERFTISAASTGSGGEIRFDWDQVRWVARFTAK